MLCYLLMLVVVIIFCSCLAPHSGLRVSAVRALESSVNMVGRFSDDREDDTPERTAAWEPPAKDKRRASPSKHNNRDTKWKTALYRKRPTPLMQKRVAVRYNFRCALCGRLLDDTWETDHIVPLTEAKSFEDAERLNSIENLQPVHRACHQIKTSREAR
jgi:5-methylcytosine-specific restriction endonuclease McrA